MYRFLFLLLLLACADLASAQSPHGDDFKMDCAACHSSDSWEIPMDKWAFEEEPKRFYSEITGMEMPVDDSKFNHFRTDFPIEGSHLGIDCRICHSSLVFSEADNSCVSCHTDMHAQSVGSDCARCHNVNTWLVDDIPELHEQNGFPLIGAHDNLSCVDCHISETNLRFDRIGNDCINCHQEDYSSVQSPNHQELGFSTNCIDCHDPLGEDWSTDIINHDFFPLTLGHDIQDCSRCHLSPNYADISSDCISCHQEDFTNTLNPNHPAANFSADCIQCHTTNPDWMPATFITHDEAYFPIYSGSHEGEWSACVDCHTNPNNFAEFNCINCHTNPETDQEHDGISGYAYESNACLACHPTGESDGSFDHNATNFPLTGAHLGIDCLECHADGYAGTPTDCNACHAMDFTATQNPNHAELNLSTDCVSCHTTEPDWMPASFDNHNDFYQLNGAHAMIANDCAACHNGDYVNTPNTCVGCHQMDYNNTSEPNHAAAQFSTDCVACHTEDSWEPATFDHDGQYFPIYSGSHEGEWSACVDCHTNPNNFAGFSCTNCHINPETNNNHNGINGYFYESNACLVCHPTGEGIGGFDHNATNFPLTGAHIGVDCLECHANGYAGTPTDCNACHAMDFAATQNPNHTALNLSTDCISCHTTEPDWMPATFDNHNDFYPLNGAHAMIANDCAACHNGDYVITPNTCVGCHQMDYNNTSEPNHVAAQFSTDCAACHTENSWEPATFDHNATNFPLTGAHLAVDCLECHVDGYAGTPMDCNACHAMDFTATQNPNHTALNLSTDCISCHTTEPDWMPASFDNHNDFYQLNGAHAMIANDCATCHNGDYVNTPNTCIGCHQSDYNNTNNPNHSAAQFPTDCTPCHSESAWTPSTFNHDGMYFPVYSGKHKDEWNQCTECHTTPNDFSTFSCIQCHEHSNQSNVNNDHSEVSGYMYESNACYACHPDGDS